MLKIFIDICVLIAIESVIYGVIRIFNKNISWEERKSGYMTTYIYMIPLYFILSLSFENFIIIINNFPIDLILFFCFLFGIIVTTLLESLIGFILYKSIGVCPWGKFTYKERGIEFLGGFSRYDWSCSYGFLTILFYLFICARG